MTPECEALATAACLARVRAAKAFVLALLVLAGGGHAPFPLVRRRAP